MVQPINKMQANGDSAAPGYSPTRVMTIGGMAWERKGLECRRWCFGV